jgi:hypothetical protein
MEFDHLSNGVDGMSRRSGGANEGFWRRSAKEGEEPVRDGILKAMEDHVCWEKVVTLSDEDYAVGVLRGQRWGAESEDVR